MSERFARLFHALIVLTFGVGICVLFNNAETVEVFPGVYGDKAGLSFAVAVLTGFVIRAILGPTETGRVRNS